MKETRLSQRFLAAVIALVMTLVLVPIGVLAEDSEELPKPTEESIILHGTSADTIAVKEDSADVSHTNRESRHSGEKSTLRIAPMEKGEVVGLTIIGYSVGDEYFEDNTRLDISKNSISLDPYNYDFDIDVRLDDGTLVKTRDHINLETASESSIMLDYDVLKKLHVNGTDAEVFEGKIDNYFDDDSIGHMGGSLLVFFSKESGTLYLGFRSQDSYDSFFSADRTLLQFYSDNEVYRLETNQLPDDEILELNKDELREFTIKTDDYANVESCRFYSLEYAYVDLLGDTFYLPEDDYSLDIKIKFEDQYVEKYKQVNINDNKELKLTGLINSMESVPVQFDERYSYIQRLGADASWKKIDSSPSSIYVENKKPMFSIAYLVQDDVQLVTEAYYEEIPKEIDFGYKFDGTFRFRPEGDEFRKTDLYLDNLIDDYGNIFRGFSVINNSEVTGYIVFTEITTGEQVEKKVWTDGYSYDIDFPETPGNYSGEIFLFTKPDKVIERDSEPDSNSDENETPIVPEKPDEQNDNGNLEQSEQDGKSDNTDEGNQDIGEVSENQKPDVPANGTNDLESLSGSDDSNDKTASDNNGNNSELAGSDTINDKGTAITDPNTTITTPTTDKADTSSITGIQKVSDGVWAKLEDGQVDSDYTGIAQNEYGWWRIEDGYVNFNATGIYQNEFGWWRVENGKVDFEADGIYRNEYGWWKTTDGKVTFDETGIFKNEYGWWRVVNSKVDFNANGIYKNKYGWWKTTNGKVTFNENGVFKNENGWWKVKDSKVDFNFTGIAKNQYGSWYIKNGKVDFSKNGKIQYNSKPYSVKNGKVQ